MSIFKDRKMQESFTINKDGRINFVLLRESFQIIKNDMEYFGDNKNSTLSHFLNEIFEKTLSIFIIDRIIDDYVHMYSSILKNLDSHINPTEFQRAFDKTATNQINERLKDYDIQKNGGIQIKFKLNLRNLGLVKEYEYYQIFKNRSLSFFIRCIFESYARLSIGEREKVRYADLIKSLDIISRANGIIKYRYNDKYESLVPLKIAFNENNQRHFVLGFSLEANYPRIRQLKNFSEDYKLEDGSYILSLAEIKIIEDYYNNNDLENLIARDPVKVYTVRFTDYGKKQFDQNTYGRPKTKSSKDSYRKVFTSTDRKMLSYFLKFGPNIEIESPDDTRELFKDFFKYSLEIYENSEGK